MFVYCVVFGVDLTTLVMVEGGSIPLIVQQSVAYIERHCLDLEGIYRLSGATSRVLDLKEKFNDGKREGERERGREGERERGREGGREREREGEREGGREGERERGREGGRERGREGGREKRGGREASER